MNNTLTFEMVLHLPETLHELAEVYGDCSELLGNEICDQYNIRAIRLDIEKKFTKFKNMKSIQKLPVESLANLSPSFNLKEGFSQRKISKPTENIAIKLVSSENYLEKFYNCSIMLATKLTRDEVEFLVKTFFYNKTFNITMSEMSVGKNKMEEIKRSCIVKTYCEFEALDDE